jgi:hypothetical protein
MDNLISKLSSDDVLAVCGMLVGVVAILGGVSVAVTAVVSAHRRRMQLDEMEATLKMEMIQRGMSAEEVSRVLESRMGTSKASWQELLSSLPALPRPAKFKAECRNK